MYLLSVSNFSPVGQKAGFSSVVAGTAMGFGAGCNRGGVWGRGHSPNVKVGQVD